MYRFIAILLISALLLTGCAKAETDSYIQRLRGGSHSQADGFCAHRISTFDTLRSP